MSKPILAIVIPCYNEEEVLPTTIKILLGILDKMTKENLISPESYLFFVDDGSKDKTWQIIKEHNQKDKRVRGVKLAANVGHQKALWAGIEICAKNSDCIITIDADLQDDETKIIDMVKLYNQGYEIVYGVRDDRSTDPFIKRLLAESFYKLIISMGVNAIFNHADFRLMGKKAVENLLKFPERNIYIRGMVPALGFKSTKVFYKRKKRLAGEPKYTFAKLFALAWEGITSFSTVPLRLISYLGLFALLITLLLTIYVLYAAIFMKQDIPPGWASILISLYFLGSVLLLAIGVIGEYIGKIYNEVKRRPHYIIEELI